MRVRVRVLRVLGIGSEDTVGVEQLLVTCLFRFFAQYCLPQCNMYTLYSAWELQ